MTFVRVVQNFGKSFTMLFYAKPYVKKRWIALMISIMTHTTVSNTAMMQPTIPFHSTPNIDSIRRWEQINRKILIGREAREKRFQLVGNMAKNIAL